MILRIYGLWVSVIGSNTETPQCIMTEERIGIRAARYWRRTWLNNVKCDAKMLKKEICWLKIIQLTTYIFHVSMAWSFFRHIVCPVCSLLYVSTWTFTFHQLFELLNWISSTFWIVKIIQLSQAISHIAICTFVVSYIFSVLIISMYCAVLTRIIRNLILVLILLNSFSSLKILEEEPNYSY